jgi:aminopeptidase N
VFLDSGTQNRLGFLQTAEQREFQRTTVIREMAHQWLEHLVGGKTYHDQWLWDGGADFAASMFLRHFEPKDLNEFRDIRRKWLLSKNSSGYRPVDAGPVWLSGQLNEYNEKGNSMFVNRYKGGYIMEMLRMLMYDPKLKNPNARFIAMMHEFTSTFAGKNASTEDFRMIAEKHAGKSMEWFFEQWVYGSETPEYDFSYQLSNAEGGQTELTMTLTQSKVSDTFRMQLPLYAVVNGEPQYLALIGITGTKPLKTSIRLPVRPEKVVLDPERNILAEIRQ